MMEKTLILSDMLSLTTVDDAEEEAGRRFHRRSPQVILAKLTDSWKPPAPIYVNRLLQSLLEGLEPRRMPDSEVNKARNSVNSSFVNMVFDALCVRLRDFLFDA